MKWRLDRMIPAIVLGGTMLLGVTSANAYFCPGDPTDYSVGCFNKPNGTPCIASAINLGCCGPGTCGGGACNIPQMQTACDDSNACTSNICNTAGGGNHDPICSHPAFADGTFCNEDDNLCTIDSCLEGVCTFQSDKDCSGHSVPEPQCQQPVCKPSNGNCIAENINQDVKCNDGFDCTYGERCKDGKCGSGSGAGFLRPAGVACWDGEFCKPGTCNGSDKACRNKSNSPAGTPCDPNNCTNATCQSNGGPCVVNSCDSTALCEQCGNANCAATTQNPAFPCGCVSQPIYNPPN